MGMVVWTAVTPLVYRYREAMEAACCLRSNFWGRAQRVDPSKLLGMELETSTSSAALRLHPQLSAYIIMNRRGIFVTSEAERYTAEDCVCSNSYTWWISFFQSALFSWSEKYKGICLCKILFKNPERVIGHPGISDETLWRNGHLLGWPKSSIGFSCKYSQLKYWSLCSFPGRGKGRLISLAWARGGGTPLPGAQGHEVHLILVHLTPWPWIMVPFISLISLSAKGEWTFFLPCFCWIDWSSWSFYSP